MDHFPSCVSPRRKVVSGFSLGILGSLVVFVVVLFTFTFNDVPFLVSPMLQGLNSTWPFSFSSCGGIASGFVSNHSDEANASLVDKDRVFSGFSREGEVLEETHVGKLPNKGNEVEKGGIWDKGLFENGSIVSNHSDEANTSLVDKDRVFSGFSREGEVLEETHVGKLPNKGNEVEKGGIWDKGLFENGSIVSNHSDEANTSLVDKDRVFSGFSREGEVLENTQVEKLPKKGNEVEKGGIWDKGLFGNGSIVSNHSDEANASLVDKDRVFSGFSREGEVLEDTHVGKLPKKGNEVEKGGIWDKGLFGNGSIVGKNASFNNVLQKGKLVKGVNIGKVANLTIWEKTHKGNKVENGTKGMVAKNKALEKDNVTNFSISGESVGSFKDRDFRLGKGSGFGEKCDIFHGRWVRDEKKPYYPAGSCPYIDRDFDCYFNGRPDDGFLKWRWQPYDCDIPSLNATDFLERLRGKKLVFVGDSLNRNMWESLVCILRHSIRDKKKVYEISGRRDFKKKGFYAFRFEDYNCSVDFVSSPFLVRESSFKGEKGNFETLRLDLMDKTTSMYRDADIVVFNTGHWWTHEKTSRGEDYYQEGSHVYPSLKVLEAYTKALRTWARWVDTHIDRKRAQVIFRGYSLTHFQSGQWNSGGQCHKESDPIFNETYLSNYPTKMKALEHTIQEMKTPVIYLNISRLTDYRKDAHPSIYRKKYISIQEKIDAERSQDCSHWCLPGVPDTWNELLYVSLLQSGKSSWRS